MTRITVSEGTVLVTVTGYVTVELSYILVADDLFFDIDEYKNTDTESSALKPLEVVAV